MTAPVDQIRLALLRAVEAGVDHDVVQAAADAVDVIQLGGHLRQAGVRAGVAALALDDLVARGREVFGVDGGKIVSKDGRAVNVEEWATALRTRAPHLFTTVE